MTAMFGYLPKPTFISLFSYFGYWAIVLFCIGIKVWRGTLTDATKGKSRGKKGGIEEEEAGEEAEEGKGKKKPAALATGADAADDSALESGGSEQDLPSAAPYLLPVVHKHLPHMPDLPHAGGGKAADEGQPKASASATAAAAAAPDVEAGAAHLEALPGSRRTRWWRRGKKE